MSKKTLKGRTKIKGFIGKTLGRSHGEMIYNEHVGHKVTPKINAAIKKNYEKTRTKIQLKTNKKPDGGNLSRP